MKYVLYDVLGMRLRRHLCLENGPTASLKPTHPPGVVSCTTVVCIRGNL